MRRMIMLAVLALSLLPCLAPPAYAQSSDELFFRANQLFREGRYEEAARGYEQLVALAPANGHLYYNLGNAYLKMNRLGPAILNYERAKLLLPRDADLAFNLTYAGDRRLDAVNPPAQAISSVLFWIRTFSLAELFWIFLAFHLGLAAVVAFRLISKSDWSYYLLMVLLFAWFMSALSFGMKYVEDAGDSRGIVLAKQADVLAGPQAGDTVLFRLHEGTCVTQERFEQGWRLISLPDGKRGWIRAGEVESIVSARLKPDLFRS